MNCLVNNSRATVDADDGRQRIAGSARGTVLMESLIAVALVVLAAGLSFSVLTQSDARAGALIEGRRALDIASLVFADLAANQPDPASLSGPVEQLLGEETDPPDDENAPWFADWSIEVSLEDTQFPGKSIATVRVLGEQADELSISGDSFTGGARLIATYHRLVPNASAGFMGDEGGNVGGEP